MAKYRAVVTKDGRIIPFPNPERYWDVSAHNDWTNYLVGKGIPANDVEVLWAHLRKKGQNTQAPNGLQYFSSQQEAQNKSNLIRNPTPPKPPRPDTRSYPEKVDAFRAQLSRLESREFKNISAAEKTNLRKAADAITTKSPKNFSEAVSNYTTALAIARTKGIENLEARDRTDLSRFARQVRDFDTPQLGQGAKAILENIKDVEGAISAVKSQRDLIARQEKRVKELQGKEKETARAKLYIEQDALARIIATANQTAPKIDEALSRVGLSDILSGISTPDKRVSELETGLQAFSGDKVFGTGALSAKLNSQLTDSQILADINEARKNEYKKLYDLGTATITDLTATLESAKAQLPAVSPNQRATARKQIADLEKQLAEVRADTVQAQNLFQRYTPISGVDATKAVSNFRERLRLPEEQAISQIREIDPNLISTAEGLSGAYKDMVNSPLGQTTDDRTEQMRGMIEDEAINQLRLGSTLDESVRREVQQASRGAQAARGNIFGVAPAVEEAMQTGMMGEQRKAQRYGAAAAFLASGQTRGDQAARNTALRQSLDLSRLGAANEFMSGGANPYNLANQRVANQNANFLNYINANTAATKGFANTANQVNPFQFVNPNAGLEGARTSAMTYGNLLDFSSRTYSAYAGAQAQVAAANSVPNYISAFTNLVPSFSFGR